MAKLKLSKNSLQEQRTNLKLYQKMLPSLDLKRSQLQGELKNAQKALAESKQAVEALEAQIGTELPMLAGTKIGLKGMVKIERTHMSTENIAGVKVPRLDRIDCEVMPYSRLSLPAWVDHLMQRLKDAAQMRLEVQVHEQRVEILRQAARRITQRVNLFDRVLIPTAQKNIKRIQIYLGDLDRDAVIRSKLSKARHA